MRVVHYRGQDGTLVWGGLSSDDIIHPLAVPPFGEYPVDAAAVGYEEARVLAPVTPRTIVCVGRNYAAHTAEFNNDVPTQPLLAVSVTGLGTLSNTMESAK